MNVYEEMRKQYEDSHRSFDKGKSQKNYDLKNYFNTSLPKGVSTLKKRIRILPPEEGKKTSITVMYGHEKKVDNSWKTYPCLKHEKDDDCPFCQSRELLLSSNNQHEKEMAKEFSPRKFYIIKVIDRDNEQDGVKFWRIKHNYKKEGILDKIMSAIEDCGHDITHPETGRDLLVTIKEGTTGKAITIGYALDSTPLSNDDNKVSEWTSDNRTWEDVYSVKNYDYLAIIVKNEIPVWDKNLNKFVSKASLEAESDTYDEDDLTAGLDSIDEIKEEVEAKKPVANTTSSVKAKKPSKIEVDEDDDDLPF